ncbi:MAG: hypothetical protein R6X25_01080 [Candidatus Krumholzibacteriia bacterium]
MPFRRPVHGSRLFNRPCAPLRAPLRRRLRTALLVQFLVVAAVVFSQGVPAQAEGIRGISYTLTPAAQTVRWSENLGLEDTELFGGQLTMNFGRYLGLQGFYYLRDGVATDLAATGLLDAAGQPLVDQEVDLRNYGVNVVMNLSTGSVVPFVKAGAGVMRFDTNDGDETSQINFKVGGGLRFGIDRVRAAVWVEDSAVRLDRYHLASNVPGDPAFPEDPGVDDLRHNLAVGAGIDISLGGYKGDEMTEIDRAMAERFRAGLKGVSVPVEIFVGSLDFDNGGLPTQNFGGVRTGIDLGRHFGLRGYYWKGLENGLDGTSPLHSYGGEAQFNLNSGQGAIPYLLVGAGHLEFEDDYEDEFGVDPNDKTMLILGGGLYFTVGDRVRLDLSVRNYLFSERDLEDVTSTDELTSNIAFAAGAGVSLGGEGAPDVEEQRRFRADAAWRELYPDEPPADDFVDYPEEYPAVDPDGDLVDERARDEDVMLDRERRIERSYRGDPQVTIPVPALGEIYVRYGQPGGVRVESRFEGRETAVPGRPGATEPGIAPPDGSDPTRPSAPAQLDEEALRQVIRQELEAGRAAEQEAPSPSAQQPTQPAAPPVQQQPPPAGAAEAGGTYSGLTTDQQLELLERRLAERIDERIDDRLDDRVDDLERRQRREPAVVVQQPREAEPRAVTTTAGDGGRADLGLRTLETVLGANLDEPEQMIVGARADLGPVGGDPRLRLVPQLDLGFFSDATSVLAAANLRYELGDLQWSGSVAPYVMFGAGILIFSEDVADRTDQEGVLNLSYGVAANIDDRVFFIEHQGVDLFDLNRVLLGIRWRFGR